MSTNTDTTPAFDVQGEDGLAGLHEYLRERSESARADVAEWNARVDLWRSRHGDKPIPPKAFEQHPAAEILASMFIQAGIVDEAGALQGVANLLSASNEDLRRSIPFLQQCAAQLLDSAGLTADPASSLVKARFYGLSATVAGLLLELRTITSEEICGLPVENIPGCIVARTADVVEGGDDE